MLRSLLSLLFILPSIAGYADINTVTAFQDSIPRNSVTEGVIIPIPKEELSKNWIEAYKVLAPNGAWVLEYIPKNEDINSWSQLIQIQFLPQSLYGNHALPASVFAKAFSDSLKEKFPSVTSTVTAQHDNNVLIEWSLPKDENGEKAQHELAEIISTPEGIYRVAFTKKGSMMEADLKKVWVDRLSNIMYQGSAAPTH